MSDFPEIPGDIENQAQLKPMNQSVNEMFGYVETQQQSHW